MNRYIEFAHIQSEFVTGITFSDESLNERLYKFPIITNDHFIDYGWYNYYVYMDDTKDTLIDIGKCYLEDTSIKKKVLERPIEKKTILKRY